MSQTVAKIRRYSFRTVLLYPNLFYYISNDILGISLPPPKLHGIPSPTRKYKPQYLSISYIPTLKTTFLSTLPSVLNNISKHIFPPQTSNFFCICTASRKTFPSTIYSFSFYVRYLKTVSIGKLILSWRQTNETVWCNAVDARRKTCPISAFLTTNPTWNDSELKTGVCCETPATNRPSHGRALVIFCFPNSMPSTFAVFPNIPRKTIS